MHYMILDVSNLAWRAFHSTGNLKNTLGPTGVLFGLMRDIRFLKNSALGDVELLFAFDVGTPLRRKAYKAYKANREENEEHVRNRAEVHSQVDDFRKIHLWDMGFRNIYRAKGYEADDIIAKIAIYALKEDDKLIIVSGDQDFYQLLTNKISVYHPRSQMMVSKKSFMKEWGIEPLQWVLVKAIAGCSSDNIKGVPGVGEKIAAKYVGGRMNPETATYKKIDDAILTIAKRNRPLVQLPWPGTPNFKIERSEFTDEKWRKKMRDLGFDSLEDTTVGRTVKRRH